MPTFQVFVNGRKIASAGVGDLGVLGAHVSWAQRKASIRTRSRRNAPVASELSLHVGGLVLPAGEHLIWANQVLEVGDVVTLKISQDEIIDEPRERKPMESATDLRAQKQYVRRMAKKFGWKIQTT